MPRAHIDGGGTDADTACRTDTLKHLEFMETPITGTLNSFVNKMIKKGLTFSKVTEEGVAIFKGDFGGYKDCEIYVYSVNMGKRVTSVAVSLPFRDTWPELSGDYEDMKKLLTKKMGQPYASIEVFENPVPYDNRMLYVTTDRCDYKTTWRRDHGVIAVAINNAEYDHKGLQQRENNIHGLPRHGQTARPVAHRDKLTHAA